MIEEHAPATTDPQVVKYLTKADHDKDPQEVKYLTKTEQDQNFRVPDIYITKQPRRKLPAKPFPLKLMEILSYRYYENINYQDIITWLPDGKSFKVLKPKEFTSQIMPRHLKRAKYSTFQRKMACWGFQKVVVTLKGDNEEQDEFSSDDDYRATAATKCHGLPTTFFHPHFQRNRTDLLEHVHFSKNPFSSSGIDKNKTPSSSSCIKRKVATPPPPPLPHVVACNTSCTHKKQKLMPSSSTATLIEESPPSSPPAGGISSQKVCYTNNHESFQLSPAATSPPSPSYRHFENKPNLPPRKRPVNTSSLFSIMSSQSKFMDRTKQASPIMDTTATSDAASVVSVSPVMTRPPQTLLSSLPSPSVLPPPPPFYDVAVSSPQEEPTTSPFVAKHSGDGLLRTTTRSRRRSRPCHVYRPTISPLSLPESDNDPMLAAPNTTPPTTTQTRRRTTTSSLLYPYLEEKNYRLQQELEMIMSERDHYKRLLVENWLSHNHA